MPNMTRKRADGGGRVCVAQEGAAHAAAAGAARIEEEKRRQEALGRRKNSRCVEHWKGGRQQAAEHIDPRAARAGS